MKNKKYLVLSVVILIAAAVVVFIFSKMNKNVEEITASENVQENKVEVAEVEKNETTSEPKTLTSRDLAWQAFQTYLQYNKDHNLSGVRSVVYKVAPVCDNSASTTECFARMDTSYSYGSQFKKGDFTVFYEDDKQAILATEWKTIEDSFVVGQERSVIFFVKEGSRFKLLRYYPAKGVYIARADHDFKELEALSKTNAYDGDKDGIEDSVERCYGQPEECIETDPEKRDTDSDGWWDGINAQLLIN